MGELIRKPPEMVTFAIILEPSLCSAQVKSVQDRSNQPVRTPKA